MRKSSLGRRSSTHIPVRVPSLGGGNTATRTCSGKKSTGSLLKPGFSQGRQRRSQSAERESYGSYAGRSNFTMQRSNTLGTMTPITPRHSNVHGSLPTGSTRGPRSQMTSTDSNRRLSSFGGTKRKDTRPIGEKSFQQAAQAKVQQYFNMYATDVIGPGNSIRPMNTKLFVDMMDHLLKNLDSRLVITKSNYLEELPQLLKKLGYRSKVDKSWLMTVNTSHSWQHVIAVLSWLVELKEIMDLTDPFEMMYPNLEGKDDTGEEDEERISIDREMVFYLKKSYQMRYTDEDRLAEILANMDDEFLERQIRELKCTDEDFETLQSQIDIIKEESDGEIQRMNLLLEEIEKLKVKRKAASDDNQTLQEFIDKSKNFVDTVDVKLGTMEKEISAKKAILEKKKEDLQKIQEVVSSQQISVDQKEKLNKERVDLQRMIHFYENAIREYQNSAFNVDMKYLEIQKKLEKLVVEYNKLVAEKVILEPRLRDVEIKLQFLADPDLTTLETVDSNLRVLKEEYKNSIHELDLKKEKSENILKRVNQDIEETKEEICKESTLLEGLECDYEKHQELANKETKKLKDDLNRYQKMTKEISEELSHFDLTKHEEKKLKLKMLEHDYDLVQKRSNQFFEGVIARAKEITALTEPAVKGFMEKLVQFEKDHLH